MSKLPVAVAKVLRLAAYLQGLASKPAPSNVEMAQATGSSVANVSHQLRSAVEYGLLHVAYPAHGVRVICGADSAWSTLPSVPSAGRKVADPLADGRIVSMAPRLWTDAETTQLRAMWPDPLLTIQEIARCLGRKRTDVHGRAHVLRLAPRPPEWKQREARLGLRGGLSARARAALELLAQYDGKPAPTNAVIARGVGCSAHAVTEYLTEAARVGKLTVTVITSNVRVLACPTGAWATTRSLPSGGAVPVDAWPVERDAQLRQLYCVQGLSMSAIAAALGLSKGAVSGRVTRLRLLKAAVAAPRAPRQPRPRQPGEVVRRVRMPGEGGKPKLAEGTSAERKVAAQAAQRAPAAPLPSLEQLMQDGCRWPLWPDMARPNHEYCGKPRARRWSGREMALASYCSACLQRSAAFAVIAEAA
ncbi:hypothetical protein EOD42_02955 [Rhodovarius crocodyli]|uniref:Uncharacterized protein n=1 Tax=Rhodovarius crocodyli TaxID=1979269 RepID=A0A437MN93_9PROT|nr:GcrA family cell cycle regulator [Rhodovarius crocodyli]RVT99082.1 hypothetical protein EOD42_02955 [Rhodovarius crocodyli]